MNDTIHISLFLAGLFDIGIFVFHVFFWKLFHWKFQLNKVSAVNKGAIQIMNIALMVVFLLFASLIFFETTNLIETEFGQKVLGGIAIFWLIRTLVQPLFFGYKNIIAAAFIGLFAAGSILHALPLLLTLSS